MRRIVGGLILVAAAVMLLGRQHGADNDLGSAARARRVKHPRHGVGYHHAGPNSSSSTRGRSQPPNRGTRSRPAGSLRTQEPRRRSWPTSRAQPVR